MCLLPPLPTRHRRGLDRAAYLDPYRKQCPPEWLASLPSLQLHHRYNGQEERVCTLRTDGRPNSLDVLCGAVCHPHRGKSFGFSTGTAEVLLQSCGIACQYLPNHIIFYWVSCVHVNLPMNTRESKKPTPGNNLNRGAISRVTDTDIPWCGFIFHFSSFFIDG